MIVFVFCILNTSGIICAPRIPVPRRKQPNSSDRNPRTTRNGVHHLTQPESSFAMSILFHQPNMSNEHSYMCAQRHTENHNYKHKQKVAPYVAPIGTWGDFVDSGGGSCATETDTCDARFSLLPILIIVLWRVVLDDFSYNIWLCSKSLFERVFLFFISEKSWNNEVIWVLQYHSLELKMNWSKLNQWQSHDENL